MRNFFEKVKTFLVNAFRVFLTILLLFLEFSCTKNEEFDSLNKNKLPEQGTLLLSLKGLSPKNEIISKVSEIEGAYEDTNVDTLDIFIFKNDGNYPIDTYKHFTSEELTNLSDIPIRTTIGEKIICVIANSHISKSNLQNVKDYNTFITLFTDLKNENVENWSMYGEQKCKIEANSSISIGITRYVAKICLSKLNINFDNTPYQNSDYTVKAYLTNIIGQKIIYNGENTNNILIYNKEKKEDNATIFHNKNLIEDNLNFINNELDKEHYFFCYENLIDKETDNLQFTRLVIELSLEGNTYYYPININQKDYGYQDGYTHHGIEKNTEYTIELTIEHPGSSDPNTPITTNDYDFNISVNPWISHPVSTIKF